MASRKLRSSADGEQRNANSCCSSLPFNFKTNLMNKANKSSFAKDKLKNLTGPCELDADAATICIIDGGWLLHQVKWIEGQTWLDIANSYLQFVQILARVAQ